MPVGPTLLVLLLLMGIGLVLIVSLLVRIHRIKSDLHVAEANFESMRIDRNHQINRISQLEADVVVYRKANTELRSRINNTNSSKKRKHRAASIPDVKSDVVIYEE